MIKIGITGGICSGKSSVCKHIQDLGYDVYYSDIAAIRLAEKNDSLKEKIIKEFGEIAYLSDKSYNRKYIASIVFNNKEKLDDINRIFSSYLKQDFINYCKGKNTVFYESALIFEHDIADMFDYIICIYADTDVIKERLKTRNNFNDKDIRDRLNSQMDYRIKLARSNYSINTTDNQYKQEIELIITDILDKNL